MFSPNSLYYKNIEQKANEIVDINSNWYLGSPSIYEEGARDKFTVKCPKDVNYPFLIPNHKYMVKKSFVQKQSGHCFYHQFWGEIIAYKVGKAFGIKTVPAFVAKIQDTKNGEVYVAMSEWYYQYPDEEKKSFNPDEEKKSFKRSGGDLLELNVNGFDRYAKKKNSTHSVAYLNKLESLFSNIKKDFAELLMLDAIIGNGDRHQSNWEVIVILEASCLSVVLSPAFDNGTSLGYEILDEHIKSKMTNIEKYINNKKATHHIKRYENDAKSVKFVDTIEVIANELDFPKERIESILDSDISKLEDELRYLRNFKIGKYSLSEERIDFILSLIKTRVRLLKEKL
jgi:hypothetical protein